MKRIVVFFLFFTVGGIVSAQMTGIGPEQEPVTKPESKKAYYFVAAGLQAPSWVSAPLIPDSDPTQTYSGTNIMGDGWFFGFGIIKPFGERIEIGFLGEVARKDVTIAKAGQRSQGWWPYMNWGSNYTPQPFNNDYKYFSDVVSMRGTLRYIYPIKNMKAWAGLAPGFFSTTIAFLDKDRENSYGHVKAGKFGLTYQLGIDFILKNPSGGDLAAFTLFVDMASPVMYAKFDNLFYTGWTWDVENHIMSPYRFGIALKAF